MSCDILPSLSPCFCHPVLAWAPGKQEEPSVSFCLNFRRWPESSACYAVASHHGRGTGEFDRRPCLEAAAQVTWAPGFGLFFFFCFRRRSSFWNRLQGPRCAAVQGVLRLGLRVCPRPSLSRLGSRFGHCTVCRSAKAAKAEAETMGCSMCSKSATTSNLLRFLVIVLVLDV